MKIDVDFEIFGVLAFYTSILFAKLLLMPVLVSRARLTKKVRKSSESESASSQNQSSSGDPEPEKKDNDTNTNDASPEVFANPEDKAFVRGGEVSIKHTDQDIERIRRAHLNDLENILPFVPLSIMYAFTNPGLECTRCLFQIFTLARIGHTVFYLVPAVRKPWLRFASCAVGWVINFWMAYAVFMHNI